MAKAKLSISHEVNERSCGAARPTDNKPFGPPTPRSQVMNQEDIRDAITLFQYSKTATMGRGPSGLATLQNLFKQGEVGFHKMRHKTLRGQYLKDRDGYDLRVNPEFLMHWTSP